MNKPEGKKQLFAVTYSQHLIWVKLITMTLLKTDFTYDSKF
jgi:hypothetical protein